jgi:hypothetical protein
MQLVHFLKREASTADDVPNYNIKEKGCYQYTAKGTAAQTAVQNCNVLTFFNATDHSSLQLTEISNIRVIFISTSIGDDSRGLQFQSEHHPPPSIQGGTMPRWKLQKTLTIVFYKRSIPYVEHLCCLRKKK